MKKRLKAFMKDNNQREQLRLRFSTEKVSYSERIKAMYKSLRRQLWSKESEKNPFKCRLMDLDEAPTPRSQKSTISKTSLAKTEFHNLFNNGNLLLKLKEARGKTDPSETKSIPVEEKAR